MKVCALAAIGIVVGCGSAARAPAARPAAPSSYTYERRYRPGSVDDYRLTLEYMPSAGAPYVQETMTRHETTARGERITFTSMARETNGKVEDYGEIARAFRGHELSLAPSCKDCVQLPELDDVDEHLVEPITDVITFFIAISPSAGSADVHRVGDRYTSPSPVVGRWARGRETPVGEDCITIATTLRELTSETATFVTSFEPPEERCLTPALPSMTAQIGKGPNNFQQIMVAGATRTAMWGREQFVVTTTVQRADGTILEARMENELALRMRMGCIDEALERCQTEVPVQLRRRLRFERVSEK